MLRFSLLLLLTAFAALAACGDDDVVPANDAGTDAATTVDAGGDVVVDAGPTFCTSQTADFCGDFDRGPTPGFGWTGVDTSGGGVLALADATETSKPKVLSASLPAVDATGVNAAIASVAKKLPLAGKKKITVTLAASFGDTKPSGNHIVSFLTLIIDGNNVALIRGQDRWFVSIARRNTGTNDSSEPQLKVTPALGKWLRLELEVVLGRPNGSVKLRIDGQEALNETAVATIGDAPPVSDDVTLAVGPSHAAGAIAASESRYDDVVLKLEP